MADQYPAHEAVHERHRLPLVWLVPIVAIIAAGWLGYNTLSQRGPLIAITLTSADGLQAGKTPVRHNQIELGVIEALQPSDDLSRVTVHVRMNRYAEGHLNTGTRFWVVRPRLSAAGISGLDTLISGAYLEMEPGTGKPARDFIALEDPPVIAANVPGTEYVLRGPQLGSVSQGSPVSFHGIGVGEVMGYTLSDQDGTATVRVFVRAPHDQLVHDGTRFWNASGISLELGGSGVRVQTGSLASILAGGVAFDVPQGGVPGALAKPGSSFTLYQNDAQARDALFTRKVPFLLHLPGSAQGLTAGAAVRMRGIRVGDVTDVHMEFDAETGQILVPVTIELEPQRVTILHSTPIGTDFEQRSYAVFKELVAHGLRAQIESGNLLTGQKVISLDFVAEAPKAEMIEGGKLPELPMVATGGDLDTIEKSAGDLLASLKTTVGSLNQFMTSEGVKHSLLSLDQSLANLDSLTRQASVQAGPLLASLRAVATSADKTLREATSTLAVTGSALGNNGGSGNLAETLVDLKGAVQSLHVLTDYLEAHPGSLVWGKSGSGR